MTSLQKKLDFSRLGAKSKQLLREFKGKAKMTAEQYRNATVEYNAKIDKQRQEQKENQKKANQLIKQLPEYIEYTETKAIRKMRQEQDIARKTQKAQSGVDKTVLIDYTVRVNERTNWNIIMDNIKLLCKKLVGKKMVFIQTTNTAVNPIFRGLVPINDLNPDTIFWNVINPKLRRIGGSDTPVFDGDNYGRLVVFDSKEIIPEKLTQKYRDGQKHCVLEPLRNMFQRYSDNSETEASRKKYIQIVNRLNRLEKEEYPDGVPEDDMEKIGKTISRCIVIKDILGKEIKRYNSKSTQYVHFTNTRQNHLDYGHLSIDKTFTNVSQQEMDEIVETHDKEQMFYLADVSFTYDYSDENRVEERIVRQLWSSKGCWTVVNEDYAIFKEFDNLIGKKHYGLDALENKQLNDFIKEGRIICATPVPLCDTPNDLINANHIDITKAYTQHKHCAYYRGFLGHIHNYARLDNITNADEFLENHLGMFQAKVIKNTNPLLEQLGIKSNHIYLLPSVEWITFIREYDLKIKLVAGCWGSSFDIEYTDDMLENRRYAIWAGKLGQDSPFEKYTFTGDEQWAKQLAYDLGKENVFYFPQWNMITVKLDKTKYYTYHHIFAFITSYTRLNMLDVMSKINGRLIKVVLDGIYYSGGIEEIKIPYKNKELREHNGFREHWYYPSITDTSEWNMYNSDLMDGNVILAGAGGTGKTHSIYSRKMAISPLYVVPSHVLGQEMRKKYGCNYTTIHRLIGEDCLSYKEMYREPHSILIDELTMTNKPFIEKAIQMYPNSQILLAGDIDEEGRWFQCRNGNPECFNEVFMPKDWKYVYYTTDYRSKDEQLKILKENIRNRMRELFNERMEVYGAFDGGLGCAQQLNQFIYDNYEVLEMKDAIAKFKTGDIWIAGTHKTNQKLLEAGVVSGYINKEKRINFTGDGIKRGSFTIHSYQGLTIEKEQVFISLDYFEWGMLYTAVSRCCHMSQITFVRQPFY